MVGNLRVPAALAGHFDIHALDDSVAAGRRLAAAKASAVAESLGTFILTGVPGDMSKLNASFEEY